MNYLVEQEERSSLPQQQMQSMHISFDTTGYPIAPLPQNQPAVVSETSKKNFGLVAGVLVAALVGSGAIGHYLGASGEAQKSQQQQAELLKVRSDKAEYCKQ
jgi:hypothetical protein